MCAVATTIDCPRLSLRFFPLARRGSKRNWSHWVAAALTGTMSVSATASTRLGPAKLSQSEALLLAVKRQDTEACRQRLKKLLGPSVNTRDADGNSLLHWSAAGGKGPLLKLLLERGADHTAANRRGESPLHWAAQMGQSYAVAILMAKGCDAGAGDQDGNNALHFASRFGHRELVESFVSAGVDPNLRNMAGCTALHLAAEAGFDDVVDQLLEDGADLDLTVDAPPHDTALHLATRRGFGDVAGLLIDAGGNLQAKNDVRRISEQLLSVSRSSCSAVSVAQDCSVGCTPYRISAVRSARRRAKCLLRCTMRRKTSRRREVDLAACCGQRAARELFCYQWIAAAPLRSKGAKCAFNAFLFAAVLSVVVEGHTLANERPFNRPAH